MPSVTPSNEIRDADELPDPVCQDQTMQLGVVLFLGVDAAAYWFAGILTVAASLVVVVVMLATSRAEDDESSW